MPTDDTRCAVCGHTFELISPVIDKVDEFPHDEDDETVVVCGECYQQIRDAVAAEGREVN